MADSGMTYRIVAASGNKAGDLVLEDDHGNLRLFIGGIGTISRGTIDAGFLEILLTRERWQPVTNQARVTLDELRGRYADDATSNRRTGFRGRVLAGVP